jgi:endonuclease I
MASWRRGTLGSAFLCIVSCLLATTRPVEATCDVDALFANADAMTNATVDATRAWLHGIASAHHSPVTYAAAYDLLETIDSRDATTVRLAYGGSAPKCREVGAFEGDACVWNREHLWPQSYGVGDSSGLPYDAPPRVDMHALVPSHAALNSARGNRVFSQILDQEDEACAEWSMAWSDGRSCESPVSTASGVVGDAGSASIGGFWQPPSSMKGFVARAMLYMALRYDGDDEDTHDLRLAQEASKPSLENETTYYAFGRLSDLLRWHASFPVADWERDRNDAVCLAQGNRNPFVDRPELVGKVFGTADEAEAMGNEQTWSTGTRSTGDEKVETSDARGVFFLTRREVSRGIALCIGLVVASFP